MLVEATKEQTVFYETAFYEVALKQSESSYPIFDDGVKTRQDFIAHIQRGFTDKKYINLFYLENNTILGLIQLYRIETEHYLQLHGFYVLENKVTAMKELLSYIEEQYQNFEIYFGLPKSNIDAQKILIENDFKIIESSYNNVLLFDEYELKEENANVKCIRRENFDDFRKLHIVEDTVYWNSDRIFEKLEEWNIYVYYQNGEPKADIYGVNHEIFGFDFKNHQPDEKIFEMLLCKLLNALKQKKNKYVYFFSEDDMQKTILSAGFRCVGEYVCYYKK